MKKIVTMAVSLIMLIMTAEAQNSHSGFFGKHHPQTLQSFFDKYADDERFQYVSVDKGLMGMASVFGGFAKDDKKVMSKMKGIKILSLENQDSDSQLIEDVSKEIFSIVEKGHFESAVEVRDKGERVNIYYRVTDDNDADMLIISKEKKEFSCIWMSGKMSKEEMMHVFSKKGKLSNGES